MPGADLLAEPGCLPQGQLEALLGPGRERDVPARRFLARACQGRDLPAHGVQGDPGGPEDLRGGTALLSEQAGQQVLGADVIVAQPPGLFLGQDNRPVGLVGEPLEHGVTPVSGRPPLGTSSVHPPGSGQAGPERGRLDPVLARGRAVPPGAVARGVDVDPVAPGRRAHAEPVVEVAAEDDREAGGTARRPAVRQGPVGSMEMQMPGLAVVPFQLRPRAGADEQRVDLA